MIMPTNNLIAVIEQIQWDYQSSPEIAEDIFEYIHEISDSGAKDIDTNQIAKMFGLIQA